jgi:hypothetical protein
MKGEDLCVSEQLRTTFLGYWMVLSILRNELIPVLLLAKFHSRVIIT